LRKRERVLLALREGPQRFAALQQASGLSAEGLRKALAELQEEGLVERLPHGSYALTERGEQVAAEIEARELLEELIRRRGAEEVVALLRAALSGASGGAAPPSPSADPQPRRGTVEVPVEWIVELVESYRKMVEARRAREELLRRVAAGLKGEEEGEGAS